MRKSVEKSLVTLLAVAVALAVTASAALGASRIKDIARVQGVRENQLVGYGLVVGLNGTGDGINSTYQSIVNMLDQMGVNVNIDDVNVDNVAAVMVTANLPAFMKPGDRIDIVVSSIADADSLAGGTLILTPLKAPNGEVYAVAQGPVSIGGYSAGATGGARKQKAFPTTGRIPNGAIVERAVPSSFADGDVIYLSLNSPDFSTAAEMAKAINREFGGKTASALDPSSIEINVPEKYIGDVVPFIATMENLRVQQDEVAKVVINERTGTIVMGHDVSVSPVAIAHGSLTITVKPGYEMLIPAPFTPGQPGALPKPELEVQEEKATFQRVTTEDIVKSLNAMGVTPSDIIAIFQALKAAGALQAELVIM